MESAIRFDPFDRKVNQRNDVSEIQYFCLSIDHLFSKVNELEQGVNLVEQFFVNTDNNQFDNVKCPVKLKDTIRKKHLTNAENEPPNALQSEAAAERRMQQLMAHFAGLFHQITQHKWAWPFMQPVDVVGLGLNDYYKVIKRPMDLGKIKRKMEAKDGTCYKHVREIYSDVRLVFKNAMKYNDERDDAYVMAKTLLERFEDKWLRLLPKVVEEETRREKVKVTSQTANDLAQEISHANMARNLNNELSNIDTQLVRLREMVVHKCRRTSVEEKKKLGRDLSQLSPDDLTKALEIVADDNPSFQATAQEVELDMDDQSESTLWRLKLFVKEALKGSGTNAVGMGNENGDKDNSNLKQCKNGAANTTKTNKRRREACDATIRTSSKKARKNSSIP
ncbi:transcription factor GTE1-like [Mercurialis annua]|uniref:transcription factor GTE1-like n=1 Tax=Mercurialis annua TaxID=3986 RepID=UPI00216061E8|nr:transcription factor GTE1-like [Mercurialis annua]